MKTESKFTGFSRKTFDFFTELEENNCKPWFEEHKYIYEAEVLKPLKAFTQSLTPSFYELDPQMDFRPNKMVSRIYRDIRFSHDKTPYKKHMWIAFQRPFVKTTDEWASFPGYFLEIGKEGTNYGMGMFQAKKKIMDAYREKIEYEQDYFREITEDLITKHGYVLGGEEYKRPVKNDLPQYFQTWIQRKGIYVMKNLPIIDSMFSEDFVSYMEKEFSLLHPFYNFLIDVCD